jgi:hypothetical protein
MKTNDKDIEMMCLEFIDLNFNFEMCGNAEKKMFIDDSIKVYKAGFKACEAKILAEAREGFEEWFVEYKDKAFAAYGGAKSVRDDMVSDQKHTGKEAFAAGAMLQAKRIKELEDALNVAVFRFDEIAESDLIATNLKIMAKHASGELERKLKQGGEE